MKKDKICIYCYKPTTEYHHCDVCHNCKAVMKNSDASEKEFFEEIRACINSINSYLVSIHETLYEIDCKNHKKGQLTPEDQKIYDFCMAFQLCKSDLEYKLSNSIRIDDRGFRKNIYTLLELSNEFPHLFSPRVSRIVDLTRALYVDITD